MAKRLFLFLYLGVLGFLLGAHIGSVPTVRPLVSEVDVYCRLDGESSHLHLTGFPEMESVLGCLRASHSHIPASQQPPSGHTNACLIRVQMTDGSSHFYRQVSTEYFVKDGGLWTEINTAQGRQLYALLRTLKTQGFQGAFPVYPKYVSAIPKVSDFLTNPSITSPSLLYDMEYFI